MEAVGAIGVSILIGIRVDENGGGFSFLAGLGGGGGAELLISIPTGDAFSRSIPEGAVGPLGGRTQGLPTRGPGGRLMGFLGGGGGAVLEIRVVENGGGGGVTGEPFSTWGAPIYLGRDGDKLCVGFGT
ncbi:hypothetical protein ACLOJK_038377 [Asimina triloba]